jgi:glycogen debranching enzyme
MPPSDASGVPETTDPDPARAGEIPNPREAPLPPPGHAVPAPIHPLVASVAAPACALGDPDGQIRPVGVQGLYVGDTRALRQAMITVAGADIDALGWRHTGPGVTTFFGTLRHVGDPIPDPTVRLDRTRSVRPDGMDETIRIRSTATAAVRLTIAVRLDCDLTPMEWARAGRTRAATAVHPDRGDSGTGTGHLVWSDAGVTVTVAAERATLDPDTATMRWQVELHTEEEITLRWSAQVRDRAPLLLAARTPADWARPSIEAADPRIGRLVDQALDDLASLRLTELSSPNDVFVAAGVPWFLTLFGRDSIWAARMMLPVGTGVADGTLRTLARRQGTQLDDASGEAPGKIMHELRRHDTRIGLPAAPSADANAPSVYYGTIDATLLWISLLADAWRWGLADDDVVSLLPHVRRALTWLGRYADSNGDGFIEYLDISGRGLANQGWKDSGTAVRFHDGSMATPPIALCEVQAYAHRAALDAAALLEAFGDNGFRDRAGELGRSGRDDARFDDPDHWRAYAADLADAFRQRFWVSGPLGDYPALGLDGEGRPIDALTSNIGHLLGTGLLSPAEEATVARRLAAPELSGGYGLRTMSTLDGAYDPLTYHCGSIWPHDTAIALLGLASMAPDPDARAAGAILANGLLTASEAFDYRLPELYSGDARDEVGRPLPHPAACRPQAWSAAAGIALLQALLGLRVDLPAGHLSVMPMVATPMRVRGLRVGDQVVEVAVDANGRVDITGDRRPVDSTERTLGAAPHR